MEIIEKEKIVEHQDGYYGPNKRDINGKANAGLTLGIIGTALGAWALYGNYTPTDRQIKDIPWYSN